MLVLESEGRRGRAIFNARGTCCWSSNVIIGVIVERAEGYLCDAQVTSASPQIMESNRRQVL